jgi:hypothetical protein
MKRFALFLFALVLVGFAAQPAHAVHVRTRTVVRSGFGGAFVGVRAPFVDVRVGRGFVDPFFGLRAGFVRDRVFFAPGFAFRGGYVDPGFAFRRAAFDYSIPVGFGRAAAYGAGFYGIPRDFGYTAVPWGGGMPAFNDAGVGTVSETRTSMFSSQFSTRTFGSQ